MNRTTDRPATTGRMRLDYRGFLPCLSTMMSLCAGCGHSTQEKVWFGAFVGSQVADYWTSVRYLDIGGTEVNPLLDDHPNDEGVVMLKAAFVGIAYAMGQIWPEHRKHFYQWGTITGSTAAAWNDRLYEKFKPERSYR